MNASFERPNLNDLPLTMRSTLSAGQWEKVCAGLNFYLAHEHERDVMAFRDYILNLLAPVERIAQERNHTSRGNANE